VTSWGEKRARVSQAAAVNDFALRVEDLGEALLALDEPVARTRDLRPRPLDHRNDVGGARAERLVGVVVQTLLEADVDDRAECREHHPQRKHEREREPESDRDAAHARRR
jgi:hypothetical protein